MSDSDKPDYELQDHQKAYCRNWAMEIATEIEKGQDFDVIFETAKKIATFYLNEPVINPKSVN